MVGLNDRRREWLENITNLKRKKEQELKDFQEHKEKELADIEEKKKKELEEAEEMLKAGVEDLTAEEEQALESLKKTIPELQEITEESLEEKIVKEKIPEEIKTGPTYEIPIEEMVTQVYQQSDYNIYNELKDTLEKVQRGDYLNQQERQSFYKRQDEFEKMSADKHLVDEKDSFGYIDRSKQVMESINKTLHSQGQYKSGDHI